MQEWQDIYEQTNDIKEWYKLKNEKYLEIYILTTKLEKNRG